MPFKIVEKYGYVHSDDRECYDCDHMIGYVNWWCSNQNAVKEHGTAVPDQFNCKFWKPCEVEGPPISKKVVTFWQKVKNFFSKKKTAASKSNSQKKGVSNENLLHA